MNAAVLGDLQAEPALNHRIISTFQDLKIAIRDFQEFKQVQSWLFTLGYAWSDDHHTSGQLYYGALPAYLYASHDANMYFERECIDLYASVDPAYIKALFDTKIKSLKGK